MDKIELEVLNLSDMKETSLLWEKYEKSERNFPTFSPVVKAFLNEIKLFEAASFRLETIYNESVVLIRKQCENFSSEIVYLFKLFVELTSTEIFRHLSPSSTIFDLMNSLHRALEIHKADTVENEEILCLAFEIISVLLNSKYHVSIIEKEEDLKKKFEKIFAVSAEKLIDQITKPALLIKAIKNFETLMKIDHENKNFLTFD